MKKTKLETGCYVEGHRGWRGILDVIELAEFGGMKVSDADREAMNRFDSGESDSDDSEIVYDLGDEAESFLNDNVAEEGYSFGWYDGEFFYWSIDEWSES